VTPPASGRSSPYSIPNPEPSGHRYVDDLEGQNDEALEGLAAKVKLLKDVSGASRLARPSNLSFSYKDHCWDWKRGPRVNRATQSDGTCMLSLYLLAAPYLSCAPQNDAFAETSGILAGTFRRMNNMAQRQGCRWLWYILFLVLVFWFFIVVWWFRR
jgi:blocked-early-in-transport protein 1